MLIKSYTLTGEIIVLKETREGGRKDTLIPALPAPYQINGTAEISEIFSWDHCQSCYLSASPASKVWEGALKNEQMIGVVSCHVNPKAGVEIFASPSQAPYSGTSQSTYPSNRLLLTPKLKMPKGSSLLCVCLLFISVSQQCHGRVIIRQKYSAVPYTDL